MSVSSRIIQSYGESMTVEGTAAKGFISAVEIQDPEQSRLRLPAGTKNAVRYRLITDAADISEGDSLICHSREYRILRVEPVSVFGEFSHNECIMCMKGGACDA